MMVMTMVTMVIIIMTLTVGIQQSCLNLHLSIENLFSIENGNTRNQPKVPKSVIIEGISP